MQRIILSSFLILVVRFLTNAQDIPLETWRTHFSYQQARLVTSTPNKIFCATDNGLFYYDLEDNSINVLTKINGLSDVNISALEYSETSNTLVIGYYSGAIDLINQGGIFTIDDFKSSTLVTDKAIKDIKFWKNKAFLGTSLGVIVVSIPNQEITENYRSIGLNGADVVVDYLHVKGDSLYAITNEGIQSGSLNKNLLDFNNWNLYPETQAQKNSFFGSLDNSLYGIKNDTVIIELNGTDWSETGYVLSEKVLSSKGTNDLLYWGTSKEIFQFDGSTISSTLSIESGLLNDFLVLDEFWLATEEAGLIRHDTQESIFPQGPISDNATNIVAVDGKIYLLYGPDPTFYSGTMDQIGYNTFDGKSWVYQVIEGFYNLSDVTQWNGNLFFSSIGNGLYNHTTGDIINHTNSNLSNSKSSLGPIITDLTSAQNLWIASFDNSNPLAALGSDGLISQYTEANVGTDSPSILISTLEGPILIKNAPINGGGMIAFDPPNNRKNFNTTNGLPANNIQSLIIDREDGAWLGTTNGLITFPDASYILDFPEPVNPVFENNLLFENDEINALAADGGNRIWISTQDGLWVFNAAFTEVVHFFTAENSPLPSNEILRLAYNQDNGEMFVQTDKGLVSFRSSSSRGDSGYEQVSIFPNPVRPGYSGLVGISGLEYNTSVKITTLEGKLIREISTNGGTVSWDLTDYNNYKVQTGVYIVFTATPEGEEKYVGKIAVVN